MVATTHYDRLYERKGITKKTRDAGNARLLAARIKRETQASAIVSSAISKAING